MYKINNKTVIVQHHKDLENILIKLSNGNNDLSLLSNIEFSRVLRAEADFSTISEKPLDDALIQEFQRRELKPHHFMH